VKRVILTYRYRIKDATTAKRLRAHARAANYVWNYCGEVQEAARRQQKRWPSAFDLIKLTSAAARCISFANGLDRD
jgi:putative transposase